MRLNFLFLLFFPIICFSQVTNNISLNFNRRYFECEDRWVAFPAIETDSSYVYGFVYLDEMEGFIFSYESKFKVLKEGGLFLYPKDTTNLRIRLQANTKRLAIIPNSILKEFNLPVVPEWLANYKQTDDTIRSLIRRGSHYNHVGASNIALFYLEKAYSVERYANGLEFELAYAYNATEQYEKAVEVLKKAIRNNSEEILFYKELGYTLIGQDKIEEAEKAYITGIEISEDNVLKREMALNMAQAYYKLKNKEKFEEWTKITKKYAKRKSQYFAYIKQLEKSFED